MRKDVREQEAKVRSSRNSGLKQVGIHAQNDAPWADHKPVDSKHTQGEKK